MTSLFSQRALSALSGVLVMGLVLLSCATGGSRAPSKAPPSPMDREPARGEDSGRASRPAEPPPSREALPREPARASEEPRPLGPARLRTVTLDAGGGAKPMAMSVAGESLFLLLTDGRVRGLRPGRPPFWIPASPPASSVTTSADGRFLLLTCRRGHNRILDVTGDTPAPYRRWKRKTGSSEGLTRDGKLLVRGDVRRQVRGYALEGHKLMWLWPADQVVVSADGRLALCRQGGTLSLLDAQTGRQVGTSLSASGEILSMAAASRDRLAWVEKDNGACRLLLSGGAPRPLPCLPTPILAFSPCGALLAITLGDRVQLHNGQTGVPLAEHRRPGARLLAAPKDGQTYAVAGLEDDRVVWFRLPQPKSAKYAVGPASWPLCHSATKVGQKTFEGESGSSPDPRPP